jgi:hypothetical protein
MRSLLALLLTGLLAASCGYSLHEPGLRRLALGEIRNLTTEPGLQDLLREALLQEMSRQGIVLDAQAPQVLHGSLQEFHLVGTAEAEGVFTIYEVRVGGKFYLRSPQGEKPLRGRGPFVVSFSATGQMAQVFASRQEALRRALRELAAEVLASLLYP